MAFQNLYFIALIPPQTICKEVTAIKTDFANHYNSKKALKVMPHITLKAPFKLYEEDHTKLLDWFRNLNLTPQNFTAHLNGFGCFDNSKVPVIFVKPQVSQALISLQKELIKSFTSHFPEISVHYHENDFSPHMTVAYRDLSYEEFTKAWQVYQKKEYKASFEVNGLYLLKHDTKQWNIISEHLLQE